MTQTPEQLAAERRQLAGNAPAAAAAVAPRWQAMLGELGHCREANLRNGAIVNQRLGSVRRALSILTGKDDDAALYGRHGAVHSAGARAWHTLAEA